MKKYILLAVCAVALAFTSCSDSEEIDIRYQVKVVVDPSDVIKSFNGFRYGDELLGLDMMEDTELAITSFIYDENGDLVESKRGYIDNYKKKASFSQNLSASDKFTIVTISYSVLEDDGDIYSAYSLENYSRLDKLSITQLYADSYYSNWTVLGLDITTIDASKGDVVVNLKPATAMVELGFKNIDYYNSVGVDRLLIAYGNNQACRFVDNSAVYSKVGDLSYDRIEELDLTYNQGSKNIGTIINVLPTDDMRYWAAAYIGEYRYFTISSNQTIDVEAGSSYVINCYFNKKTFETEALTRASSAVSNNDVKKSVLATELFKIVK